MPSDELTIHAILERVKPGGRPRCFQMWFCRDKGAHCVKQRRISKHCNECILGKPNETLGEIADRIERGEIQ